MLVFNYLNYKDYLRWQITEHRDIRGYQGKMAEAAGCQRPYLSQVLNGDSHLSLEQVVGLSDFWNLKEDETEYFMILVQWQRAGTSKLKSILKTKINRLKRKHANLGERFKKPRIHSVEAEAAYYSSWTWAAVHILLSIPQYQQSDAISRRLNLPLSEVQRILQGLMDMSLVKKVKDHYTLTENHIHLPKTSPFNALNHANWRNRAMQNASLNLDDSLHYTGIHSLSFDAIEAIRSAMLASIDKAHDIIRPAPEEELVYLGIDLFKV